MIRQRWVMALPMNNERASKMGKTMSKRMMAIPLKKEMTFENLEGKE
jgi:hypothetical protein